MKKIRPYLLIVCILPVLSCGMKEKKLGIQLVLNTPIDNDQVANVTTLIQGLSNYYIKPNQKDTIIIPEVTVRRDDLDKTAAIDIPLSGSDNLRKKIGILSIKQIISTYDREIPHITLPALATEKKAPASSPDNTKAKYPPALTLDVNRQLNIDSLKKLIYDSLAITMRNDNIVIVLNTERLIISPPVQPPVQSSIAKVVPAPAVPPKELHSASSKKDTVKKHHINPDIDPTSLTDPSGQHISNELKKKKP